MKRTIKFRIWIPEAEYSYTKTGMYYQEDQYLSSFLRRVYQQFGVNHPAALVKKFQVEDRLMQYTGLKDKQGKEIYEGDILSMNSLNYICYWNEGLAKFSVQRPHNKEGEPHYSMRHTIQISEIVGNIYENPELIKEND